MKRRTMLAGLGMLATGSGTVVSSAALADSTTATTDIRVISDGAVSVRAGEAFEDDGSVKSEFSDQYVAYEETEGSMFFQPENGLNQIEKDDIPVATVNARDENTDDAVIMEAAISTEIDTFVFENFLEVGNSTGDEVEIGIGYDREADQYGDDVNTEVDPGDGYMEELTPALVQHIYQFRADFDGSNTRISPDPDKFEDGDTTDFPEDEGNAWYTLSSGDSVQISLEIDLTDWQFGFDTADPKEIIRDEADEDPFEETINTVDLLDEISIGTRPE